MKSYKDVLDKIKDSEYAHFKISESEEGLDVVTTVNERFKIVPMQPEGNFRGVTLFIPVTHTDEIDKLDNTTAQIVHTINSLALTAVTIDAVTDCGTARAATIMSLLGMKADSGLAAHKVRVLHVEGDFNIARNSRKGMVTILISLRESLDNRS